MVAEDFMLTFIRNAGSIKNNVVVNGKVPWTEAFARDFWGTPMLDVQSHKSFRPLTTLSFKLNWIAAEFGTATNNVTETTSAIANLQPSTFGFHVVNVLLHGLVTALVTEASKFLWDNCKSEGCIVGQLLTGFLFALHPVHAEAVSNLTSRGELLMSVFFLLAFLSFANYIHAGYTWKRMFFVYIVPWTCMTASLFSKEQGATTLIALVIYEFVQFHGSLHEFWISLVQRREATAVEFCQRTAVLAMQTIAVCTWRYWLNGETSPDFIPDQNPAAFAKDRFTRVFSVSWVYCLYVKDALYPRHLSPDWSGISIDLIERWDDPRVAVVLLLWTFAAALLASLMWEMPIGTRKEYQGFRKSLLIGFWGFLFTPFFLSSNLLVVIGLMKADRVIYLPLMGFCLLEAQLFTMLCTAADEATSQTTRRSRIGYILVMLQLFLFACKLHERNLAWESSLRLWMLAYETNSKSHHTIYNCGYELSLQKRYSEAETVLRPIADPHVDGPSNTFVYAMTLYNMGRCDIAERYIDKAMEVLREKRSEGGVRNRPKALSRVESNLLVARSFCHSKDSIPMAGQIMYEAVKTDPTNEYAIQQAQVMMKQVEAYRKLEEHKQRIGLKY